MALPVAPKPINSPRLPVQKMIEIAKNEAMAIQE